MTRSRARQAATLLAMVGTLAALGTAAAQTASPMPAPAASAAAPAGSTDPGMIVRPPAQVDPKIRQAAPRNVDPGLVERPPADAAAASDRNARPAPRPSRQPAR